MLADSSAGGTRRQIAARAVAAFIDADSEDKHALGAAIVEAREADPELFERFLGWMRTDLGETGRRAAIVLRGLVLESLLEEPAELVKCTAGWLKTPEPREETRVVIRAIMMTPEMGTALLAPLSLEYWNSRDDVELILKQLGHCSSNIVRQITFAKLLVDDPQRFIAAAIVETQDRVQFREEALEALGDIAETSGPEMAFAIRRGVTPTNRQEILRLMSDFRISGAPLSQVAADLWLTHLLLSFKEWINGSEA